MGIRGLVPPPLPPRSIGLWVVQEKNFWGLGWHYKKSRLKIFLEKKNEDEKIGVNYFLEEKIRFI
jgi:hypothetical protein